MIYELLYDKATKKFTQPEIEEFFELLKEGNTLRDACGLTGVYWKAVKYWINSANKILIKKIKGKYEEKENDFKFIEFLDRYERNTRYYIRTLIETRKEIICKEHKSIADCKRAEEILKELKARDPKNWSETQISILEDGDEIEEDGENDLIVWDIPKIDNDKGK